MKSKAVLLPLVLAFILTLPSPSMTQSKDPNKIYKVAILPFMIHSQENLDYLREGINDILTSRITVEERVVVIDRSIVERALFEEKPMTARTTAKNRTHRCLKVTATPVTMTRENKRRATSPPKLKSPRAHTTNRYARAKISKDVKPLSVDQKCQGRSFDTFIG